MNEIAQSRQAAIAPDVEPHRPAAEVLYTPQGVRRGGVGGWQIMFHELAESRRLIWLLILRDISVRYRQSILGYVWASFRKSPRWRCLRFFTLHESCRSVELRFLHRLFTLGDQCMAVVRGMSYELRQQSDGFGFSGNENQFSARSLGDCGLGPASLRFFRAAVPVVTVFIWCGVLPSWESMFIPLLLVPVVLLALGLGFVLSIANLVIRDTANALGTALTIGMFLTPVLYPPPVRWPFYLINLLNPLSPLLAASQDLIAEGFLTKPEMLAAACVFSTALFLAGWRAFRITILRVLGYA